MEGEQGVTTEPLVWSYLKVVQERRKTRKTLSYRSSSSPFNLSQYTSYILYHIPYPVISFACSHYPIMKHLWQAAPHMINLCLLPWGEQRLGKGTQVILLSHNEKELGRWRMKLKGTIKRYLACLAPSSDGLSPACGTWAPGHRLLLMKATCLVLWSHPTWASRGREGKGPASF